MPKAKGQKSRSRSQIARDRKRIAELYLKGWLQADIGDELNLSQPTVSNDLKALHGLWLKESLRDIDELKSRELAKVDNLELEYWDAWNRSREAKRTQSKKSSSVGENESRIEAGIKEETVVGDPRFLAGVQWCIERRCKLLGIDAPTKVAPTDPTGEREYEGFSDEELTRRVLALVNGRHEKEA